LEWTAADSSLSTLVSSGVQTYTGLAVDGAGNVYLPDDSLDGGPVGIVKWTAADDTLSQLNNLGAISVALDIAGNVYFTSTLNGLAEWIAAKSTVIDLHHGAQTFSLEVDGSGNVYLVNFNTLMKWTAADNTYVPLLSSTLSAPTGVAVDSMDNVYITDFESNTLVELPHAFVDPTPRLEGLAAGNDALPMVLPSAANLLPPFSPTSDQSWLTITGITNGVVSFSFTDNTTGPSRTANITLLGQTIPITQGTIGTPPTLIGVQWLGGGVLQFGFTNSQSASLTVLSTTNLALPLSNWTVVGTATNMAPGQFQFTSQPTTNDQQRFYRVRSP
jgi:hypothetical protein